MSFKSALQSLLDRSIVVYRGASTTLSAQSVALVPLSQPREVVKASGDTVTVTVRLIGDDSLDLQDEDRFKVGGVWYTVVQVGQIERGVYREALCIEHTG